MNSATHFKKSAVRSAVLFALSLNGAMLGLSAGTAHAGNTGCATFTPSGAADGNFTMLTPQQTPTYGGNPGYTFGGTNDVTFTWDGTIFTSSSDYTGVGSASNATISSPTTFFGKKWTAHDVQIFGPGTYTFDSALANGGSNAEAGTVTMTVGANQIGAHMLFDWNNNLSIDVVNVWNLNSTFSSCGASAQTSTAYNCLWTGVTNTVGNSASTVFSLHSTDNNGDGTLGVPMAAGGPFGGYNANFNLQGTITLTSGTPCNPTVDTIPDQFTFTDVPSGATPNTLYTSNAITVSGISAPSPISISGGQYAVSSDGGTTYSAYSTNTPATVANGDMVKVQQTSSLNSDGTTTNTTLNIGGVFDTYSVTVIDKKPNPFICPGSVCFTDQTGVATSTLIESNAITVGGMDTGLTTPISISGGEYSVNGAAYSTTTPSTVQNGDTVKLRQLSAATGATTTIATLTLGQVSDGTAVSGTFSVRTAGGVTSTGNNFTMIDPSGGVTGGTNDVIMDWDQQFNTSTSDPVTPATAHMHLSSATPFFQFNWTAHHIRVFGPGTYTINVDCTTAQIEAGSCTTNSDPTKNYTFIVGANQIGAHMLFDWNTTKNIDVVDVWDQSATFGPSPLYTGTTGCANTAQVWDLMSGDWDGDGRSGAKMIDGPFKDFSANFNIRTVTPALPCSAYTPTVNVASPSNAPGCSISPTPVSALKRADWWLVAGFLAWLGAIRIRSKRKTQS